MSDSMREWGANTDEAIRKVNERRKAKFRHDAKWRDIIEILSESPLTARVDGFQDGGTLGATDLYGNYHVLRKNDYRVVWKYKENNS